MGEKIKLRIVPNAPKSECVGEYLDAVKIKIAAQAVDGKANSELIKFLSKALGVSKQNISIVSGDTAQNKVVEISNSQNCRETLLKLSKK